MTKALKFSTIYTASLTALVVARLIFGFVNLSDNISGWLFSTVMQCGFMGLMPLLMYRMRPKPDVSFAKAVGLKIPDITVILLSVAAGIIMFLVNIVVSSLSNALWEAAGYTSVNSSGTIYSGIEVFILEAVTGALMPAVFEEITHRGVLLGALDENGVPDFLKVLIMALFFGMAHQNVTQLIPTFVVGIIVSVLAIKTRSLIPGMIIHFLNNFLITLLNFSIQWGLSFAYIYAFVTNVMFMSNVTLAISLVGGLVLLSLLVFEMCRVAKASSGRRRAQAGDEYYGEILYDGERKKRADPAAVAMLAIGFAVCVGGTVFTLIWGLMR